MLLRSFFDAKLAQNSYLVACQATGEAIVIDPIRNVEIYLRAAAAEGIRIVAVTETHIHADFVSGCRELAARTGAMLYLSAEGGAAWQYGYVNDYPHRLLRDGDCWQLGNLRWQALHTPGHTPEHMSYLLTDGAATDLPMGIFSGDFVFVGDVGRPDLLETAVGVKGSKEGAARTLFQALQRFQQLPDYVQIWPAHGAGSACGKALGAVPSSTVGYERRVNWAFQVNKEADFIETILDGQPTPPRYFSVMKRVNRDGPSLLAELPKPPCLCTDSLVALQRTGVTVVDTRAPTKFAAGHVPGSINVPFCERSFITNAGSFLDEETPYYLIIDSADVMTAVSDLVRIGLDQIAGYFLPWVVDEWARQSGLPLGVIKQVTVDEVTTQIQEGNLLVIDVRNGGEFKSGHLPQARHIALSQLADYIHEIPRDHPVVVQCKSGFRSSLAAALLCSQGYTNVANLSGGYQAWCAAGLPTVDEKCSKEVRQRAPRGKRPASSKMVEMESDLHNTDLPYWMEMSHTPAPNGACCSTPTHTKEENHVGDHKVELLSPDNVRTIRRFADRNRRHRLPARQWKPSVALVSL
ncbi:MAG: MBL fold metallo-hydrolase [Caldilineaceae bacterium]